jgi:glycosyltransferase involved in cell wall biosynthesis
VTDALRVLVGAYACEPDNGSEPGVGWEWVKAIALDHDVTVLTRQANRAAIERRLGDLPPGRIRFEYLDLSPTWLAWKRRGLPVQLYYLAWQRRAAERARGLHARQPFDVVHHLTFACDWLPAGVLAADAPVRIWGPVGGISSTPWRLYRWLGIRGSFAEVLRRAVAGSLRAVHGRKAARRATLIALQNQDGVKAFSRWGSRVVLEPNVVVPHPKVVRHRDSTSASELRTAAYVGRLLPLKGVAMAVAAIARPEAASWRLLLVGDGPDRRRLQRLAKRLGVLDKLEFRGQVSRTRVLELLVDADAMIFPSTHDAAGFVVAESLSVGTPVICLDLAGPAQLARGRGTLVPISGDAHKQFARALTGLPECERDLRWTVDRLPERIGRLYAEALDGIEGAGLKA